MDDPTFDTLDPFHAADRRLAAEVLRASIPHIALAAAQRLVADHPDLAHRWRPTPVDAWRDAFSSRLADLCEALAVGHPEVFVNQIAWSRDAFAVRGVPVSDLRHSLHALREAALREVPHEDQAPLEAAIAAALHILDEPARPSDSILTRLPRPDLARRYLLAIFEGNRRAACDLVLTEIESGRLAPLDAYEQVILPVQHELGRLWHAGDITVAEEHFGTATTQTLLAQIYRHLPRKAENGFTVICASVEGNAHDVAVRVVADCFEMEGWRSIYLGSSVPAEDLATAVNHFSAHLLALSTYMPGQITRTEDTIAAVKAARPGIKVLVGGATYDAAPNLWASIGADAYASRASAAPTIALSLLAK